MDATGQRDHYTTGCKRDYIHFKEYYKMIAVDLNKQQVIEQINVKTIQQICFATNLYQ